MGKQKLLQFLFSNQKLQIVKHIQRIRTRLAIGETPFNKKKKVFLQPTLSVEQYFHSNI